MDTQKNMDPQIKRSQPEQIHLQDYLAVIKKRKWVVILFSAILIWLVAVYSFLATSVYQATAQIIIEREVYPITRAEQTLSTENLETDFYQTQYNLLQSRSLALRVIKELELWKDFETEHPAKGSDAAPEVKTAVTAPALKTITKTSPTDKGDPAFSDWSDAVDWYLDSLKIEPVKESRLINVSFKSRSPQTAARVANAHAHAFIDWSTEMKVAASQQKLNWLKQRPQPNTALASGATGSVSNNDANIFSLPEVAQDSVILNLRNQLITLKAKRLELGSNFGPLHPKMVELNAQITQLEQEISKEAQRVSRVVSSSFENSNMSIVDEAEVPLDPIRPRRALNILMAVMMSMFMGPFLAFFIEYMDRTVKTTQDVERRLGMPALGAVPLFKTSANHDNGLLDWENHRSPRKKSKYYYDGDMAVRLIPSLLTIGKQPRGNVVFIASATSGEGKTTVLANAAIGLAHRGIRVLAIDTDVFNPALHKAFGVYNDSGMASLLSQMLAQNIRSGDLNAYSVDDLFFLISLQRLSGNLTVTNEDQSISAHFEDGRFLHLLSEKSPSDQKLGTMLLRGGHLTYDKLKEASEWQKRTGQPLGYILVNSGFITRELLHGPIKLQMEEHLHRLFTWKQGTFTFESSKTTQPLRDERIYLDEDFTDYIKRLGRAGGSRFIESRLLARIIEVKDPQVWVLPVGSTETKPNIGPATQMLFAKCLEVLKEKFDVIFVDAPPILDMPDSANLAREGDGVMFVAKAGMLPDKAILQATERLRESGANILGVVLNQVRLNKGEYV